MTPAELKTWRKSLDLTQAEAAAELGIGRRTLQEYEKDERPIPQTVALATEALSARRAAAE